MSERLRRSQSLYDLNYAVFHDSGEKVGKSVNMDVDKLKLKEKQIRDDLSESLRLYDLQELDTVDDVLEGLEHVTDIGKSYRHVLLELEAAMGEVDYLAEYPKAGELLAKVRSYQSNARAQSRRLRHEESEKNATRAVEERRKQEEESKIASLEVAEQVFRSKLDDEIKNFTSTDIDEIKHSIKRFESLLDECYSLLSKAKVVFSDTFDEKYKQIFDDSIKKIRGQIKDKMAKIGEVTSKEREALVAEKAKDVKLAKEKFVAEQTSHAEILTNEIVLRSQNLVAKCVSSNLKNLDDYELLDRGKNMMNLDVEMREILNKFSEVSKIIVSLGTDGSKLLDKPRRSQEKALKARNSYVQELHGLIVDRDISEEKLKKSKSLSIELPKFDGYESKLDIYSFRYEFEKLIQPSIQKQYWVDILKKNYLSGSALTLVDKCENIDEIWEKLTSAYGNMKLLLQNKISHLDKFERLDKLKGDEKIGSALAKIINMMTELSSLAHRYKLEYKLYVGGGLEKVLSLLGNDRERRFVRASLEKSVTTASADPPDPSAASSEICAEKGEWESLKTFLEKERALREKMTLLHKSKESLGMDNKPQVKPPGSHNTGSVQLVCYLCGKKDHVVSTDKYNRKMIDYFSCKKFVDMSPKDRYSEVLSKKFCIQCLRPGMKFDDEHKCYKMYACPDPSHAAHPKGVHVLLCDTHKNDPANVALLEKYKERIISKRSNKFKDFTKNISLICVTLSVHIGGVRNGLTNVIPDIRFSAIFMLQTIIVDGVTLRLFFDTGCGDIVVKKSAMDALKRIGRAQLEIPGPIGMSGVGDQKSSSEYGVYSVVLPLKGGENAVFSGVCMDRVTMAFPTYELKDVENDIRSQCKLEGGDPLLKSLPKLPSEVGGDTDILIGAKYFYTHPREVWRSKSGLSLFDSSFVSADGTTGIVYGPHKKFSETEEDFRKFDPNSHSAKKSYLSSSVIEYRNAYQNITGPTALGNTSDSNDHLCGTEQMCLLDSHSGGGEALLARKPPKCVKTFDEVDTAGTEVTYRCIDCRGCENCRKSKRVDAISHQEEVEQHIIERNVTVDVDNCTTSHLLPFVVDPDIRLDPIAQERLAMKIYQAMVKKLSNSPAERDAIIKSEGKLRALGYVQYLDELPKAIRDFILSHIMYFIPWRAVFNGNSVSTPWRLVFDASASPSGKCSLNSLLAKGTNNLNNLVMMIIRWLCYTHAFHTDISKMYNTIWLDKEHWRYQLYFWEGELKMGVAPRPTVIKTAIYGVRSSGNVAESGIRKTAELTKADYPRAYDVMMDDLYVDDCLSGANSEKDRSQIAEELSGALLKGGFKLKGFTFSGMDPPEHMANDDKVSVNVGGMVYFPKPDYFSLKIPELNFAKKQRGKKSQDTVGVIPDKLTMKNCVSVTYEIFDPPGRVAPLVSGFKIDISELHMRKLDWDDFLPENLRQVWISNIEMIQEIRNIRYRRAVIPDDAVDLNCETIDTADASPEMICVAIYIRFRLKSGGHSCQLLFARTKSVPKDMTQPRAELLAASMNAATGHIVKTALGERHTKCVKLTDSQVALFWINSYRSKLKMWVRNQCIEINRLAPKESWRYVRSKDMIADIGTRKGATIADVGPDSQWINGFPWMKGPESEFPMLTPAEIILCGESKQEMLKECISIESISEEKCNSVVCTSHHFLSVPEAVGDRYRFSNYVLDPNKFRFRKVVRVLGLVLLFIKKLREKTNKPEFSITTVYAEDLPGGIVKPAHEDRFLVTSGRDADSRYVCPKGMVVEFPYDLVSPALQYFFRMATKEVKHFLPESKFKNLSEEKSGILFYTGRILPTQEIGGDLTMCDVCLDLAKSSFCVPIVDGLSPLAYSIASEIHWYHSDVMHGGLESVLRETNKVAFIIGGRGLLKSIKDDCARCRFLHKQEVRVAMGPKHDSNLCVAPAFFNTQVDLCGPFDSFSNVNKRAKVKIWLVVFCCSTTGATDIKLMEDYSTDSFILAFIRFACRYGYPSSLYPDSGSQLIKACNDMILSFSTIKYKLEVEFGVQFFTCPVGSHYVHGKVERKIRDLRKSINKHLQNQRFSIIQWETLGQQIANSINNMPIGLANKVEHLENLDILTPNRLLLGRNNNRCPTAPLVLSGDVKKIIKSNDEIFRIWFKTWLVSYVPTLVPRPKWFETNRHIAIGDVVLFSKSEKEFEHLYQYGIVTALNTSNDGLIRSVEVTYQNHTENVKRVTTRGVRELIVIHPVEQLGISTELYNLAAESSHVHTCHCWN